MFEKSMMERKKEMISELTNTAWSILEEFNIEYVNKQFSLEEAQRNAIIQIEKMRYGNERKDYFWIIDYQPKMIMHPYRKELNNTDLSDYIDSHEKKLFVDAVGVVDSLGQGFIEYYWQWKDDETKDVPKLSFVKEFKAWNWILGTGIYLEDVSEEISTLKRRLFKISSIIIVIIIITIIYIIRQSLIIENKRRKAEEGLKLSRLKYKSLVDASTEGTLMFLDEDVIFANQKFIEKFINSDSSVLGLKFDELFDIDLAVVLNEMEDPDKSLSIETQIIFDKQETDVVISISRVDYSGKLGYIVVVKNVTSKRQLELSSKKLSEDVEFSLQLMHQSILPFVRQVLFCELNSSIHDAAVLMKKKNEQVIFVRSDKQIVGVVNNADLKNRVIAEGISGSEPISTIMTSPVQSIFSEALMYEAILRFKNRNVSHLIVKDEGGSIEGVLSYADCLAVQQNSLSYLIQQINGSDTIKQLKDIYAQLPLLISALVSSSDNIHHITRLITTVSDSISCRVIQMGIDQLGPAPGDFAFIAMGSAGRSEQTLKTDQDNAIIYDDGIENADEYFLKLADFVNTNLNIIGYNSCKGLIMAKNPQWCKPLKAWKQYFSEWIEEQDVESILDCKIFFDLKFIYGNKNLVNVLRSFFINEAKANSLFLYHLANSNIKYKPVFENNIIDLKKVMIPLLGYIRIKSLYSGINETNSMKRLYKLFENNSITLETCEEIEKSYEFLMHQRLKYHAYKMLKNEEPENEVHVNELTSIELEIIKNILKQIQGLQSELSMVFKTA